MATYTFSDVEFTNLQVVTESDMDQVSENIQYAREECRARVLCAFPDWAVQDSGKSWFDATAEIRWQAIANGATLLATGTATASTSPVALAGLLDIDLSALALDTAHTVLLRLNLRRNNSSDPWDTAPVSSDVGPFSFVRTPDVVYLSVIGTHWRSSHLDTAPLETEMGRTFALANKATAYLRGVSMMLHRDAGEF